ncbi:MAG: fasciclin domain-containing protein [Parvularculaceae bacterium]|nr:fasciclin domain-containing protein [Parvularculaceae bacterium]
MVSLKQSLLLASLLMVIACGAEQAAEPQASEPVAQDAEEPAPLRTMAAFITDEPRFSTLRAALEAADMMDVLETSEGLTLFAPNNAAFDQLPEAVSVQTLLDPAYKDILRTILAYHVADEVVQGAVLEAQPSTLTMASGHPLPFDGSGGVVSLGTEPGTAVLVLPDIQVANGRVHVIDAVLLPPSE